MSVTDFCELCSHQVYIAMNRSDTQIIQKTATDIEKKKTEAIMKTKVVPPVK